MMVLEKKPWEFLTNDDLHQIARELFKGVDMVRAFEQDYELAIKVLRDVYDRGRSNGAMDEAKGPRC